MPEDYFRPRVAPAHGTGPLEAWPDEDEQPAAELEQQPELTEPPVPEEPPDSDPDPDPDPDDLLGPFDAIRRVLDAQRAVETAEGTASTAAAEPPDEPARPAEPGPSADPEPPPHPPSALLPPSPPAPATPVTARRSIPDFDELPPGAMTEPDGLPPHDPGPGPDEATVNLALPAPKKREGRTGGRGKLLVAVSTAGALAFCAGVAVAVSAVGHGNSTGPSTAGASADASPRASAPGVSDIPTPDTLRAVSWVTGAIGPGHVVACDRIVCSLLQSDGFPASALDVVSGVTSVEQADVVILTGVLRSQLGTATDMMVAPEPLAVFGTGANRVEVAAVVLTGPAAYTQDLAADRAGRRLAGTALLADSHLTLGAAARSQLAAGLVDARVCALLALLTGTHSITLAGFTPTGPGAGPDIPSTGVVITTVDGQPAAGSSVRAVDLLATVQAQQAPYQPMSAAPGSLGPQQGLQIIYSQPGPLGLLPSPGSTS